MTDRFISFIQAVISGITHGLLSNGISNDGSGACATLHTPGLDCTNVSHCTILFTILLFVRLAEAPVGGVQKQSPEVATPEIVRGMCFLHKHNATYLICPFLHNGPRTRILVS